jgi:hypothetical protein
MCWILPTVVRIGDFFGWYNPIIGDIGAFMSYTQGFWDTLAYCYTCPVFREWEKWYNSNDNKATSPRNEMAASGSSNNGEDNAEPSNDNRILLTTSPSSDRRQLSTLQINSVGLFHSNWDEYSDEEDSNDITYPRL